MKVNLGGTVLRINISFAAAVTLTLIVDKSGLCATAFFCCVIHEMGHIISLMLLGEKPKIIELSFYGVKLERFSVSGMKSFEEIIIYASGPTANFALSALLFIFGNTDGTKTAWIISLCVGLFNLLPCQPLDGGNILKFFLERCTEHKKSEKICFYVSCMVIIPMSTAGVILILKSGNITLLAVSLYLAAVVYKKEKGPDV